MQQHVEKTMFEDFAADVYAPVLPPNSASMYGFSITALIIILKKNNVCFWLKKPCTVYLFLF